MAVWLHQDRAAIREREDHVDLKAILPRQVNILERVARDLNEISSDVAACAGPGHGTKSVGGPPAPANQSLPMEPSRNRQIRFLTDR